MVCKNCGQQIPANAAFCDFCGARLNDIHKKIFCGNCGAEIEEGSEFCGSCGASINGERAPKENTVRPKKKNMLAIITIIISLVVVILIAAIAGFMLLNSSDNRSEQTEDSVAEDEIGEFNRNTVKTNRNRDEGNKNTQETNTDNEKNSKEKMPDNNTVSDPVFTRATASSIRGTDTEGGQYSIEAVLNTDNETKWVPSKNSDNGISEWIEIYTDNIQYAQGIEILNGYHKSYEIWKNNNRVKSCTITFSNGETRSFVLDDTMDLIKLDLGSVVETTSIRLTINSVYDGIKWNDTAITYLGAY